MVRFTIFNRPPPTSCLYFTSPKSGSIPVVSQSIRKLIVPVGASTVACAFRNPGPSHRSNVWFHKSPIKSVQGLRSIPATVSHAAARCLLITPVIGSRLVSNPANGPIRAAMSPEAAYAAPVIKEAAKAAHRRPSGES